MSFSITREALKIEKINHVRAVRLSLLFLFGLATVLFLSDRTTADVQMLKDNLVAFLEGNKAFPGIDVSLVLSVGKTLFLDLIALFFMLYYFVLMFCDGLKNGHVVMVLQNRTVDDPDKHTTINITERLDPKCAQSPLRTTFKFYPYLLVLALASFSAYIFTMPLYNFAFYIFITMFCLCLPEMIINGKGFFNAMEESYQLTHGIKFVIFIQIFVLETIFYILETIVLRAFALSWWQGSIFRAFAYAFFTLACGRLLGIIYAVAKYNKSMKSHYQSFNPREM